jgi:hypothetical protein
MIVHGAPLGLADCDEKTEKHLIVMVRHRSISLFLCAIFASQRLCVKLDGQNYSAFAKGEDGVPVAESLLPQRAFILGAALRKRRFDPSHSLPKMKY